jgi:hypothetical protein
MSREPVILRTAGVIVGIVLRHVEADQAGRILQNLVDAARDVLRRPDTRKGPRKVGPKTRQSSILLGRIVSLMFIRVKLEVRPPVGRVGALSRPSTTGWGGAPQRSTR